MPAATRPPRRRAFTLVELVVVIVVIGILAGIAAVSYHTVMSRSADEVFLENQRNVAHDTAAILAFRDGTSPSMALALALAEMPSSAAAPGDYAAGCTFTPQDRTAPLGAVGVDVSVCGWTVTQTAAPANPQPGHVTWQANGATGINFQAADADAPHTTSCVITTTATCTSAGIAPPADPTTTTEPPAANTAPSAPQSPSAVAGSGTATISFAPPTNNGGSPITTYTVTSNPGGITATGSSSPITVNGLTNGTSYTFSVTATNAVGPSAPSAATSPVTPIATADQVQHVTAVAHAASIAVSWDALVGTAAQPLTGYRVFANGTLTATVLAGSTSTTLLSLTNGTTYNIQVAAYGPAGQGSASDTVTATPTTAPDAPANVELAAGVARIDVTWDQVADTAAAPITGYRVYVGGVLTSTLTADTTSLALTDLTANTAYTVQVTAYGPAGESAASAAQIATTFAPPATPGNVTLTVAPSQLGVSWDTVASTANAPVAGYRIYVDGVFNSAVLAPVTSTTLAGLTNGTTYTVQVTAYGDAGESDGSAPQSATPIGAPEAPVSVNLAAGNAKIDVSWSTVANTLGAPVTGYRVFVGGVLYGTYAAPATSATIDGLTNGTTYTVQVATYGPAGQSSASAAQHATPVTVPGAPSGVGATNTSTSTVTWTTPANDGGSAITGYTVTATATGQTTRTATAGAAATTAAVGPLTDGVTYTISVIATNAAGGSAAGTTTVMSLSAPAAMTGVTATAGDTTITVSWPSMPSTAGQPITGYRVFVGGALDTTVLAPATSATLTGKTNGTAYSIQVAAYGAGGQGSASTAIIVTPRTVPDSPSAVGATRVSPMTSATVSWTAPTWNGGAPVTSYKVFSSTTGATWTQYGTTFSASPVVVNGLNAASSYYFEVVATNAAGDSAPGISLGAVSGATAPGAASAVAGVAGSGQVVLTWTAPSDDGASPITDYVVKYATSVNGTYTTFNDGISTVASASVTGLTNGTTYYFKVAAVNAVGTGPDSAASAGLLPQNPYAGTMSLAGTYAWYRFDSGDSGTTLKDSSGNNHPGTKQSSSAPASNQTPGPLGSGEPSTYGSFASSYATIPAPTVTGNNAYTLEAWVNPNAAITSLTGIIGNTNAGYNQPRNDVSLEAGNGYVNCNRFPGSNTYNAIGAGAALTPGVWTHVACTYDGSTLSIYVNGVLKGSTASTGSMGAPATMYVGQLGANAGTNFNGRIAEAATYATALPASTLFNHFAAANFAQPAPVAAAANKSVTVSIPNAAIYPSASYRYYRNGILFATTSATSYTDTGLTNDTSYSYTYQTVVGGTALRLSAAASATPSAVASFGFTGSSATYTVPAGVTSLTVTVVGGSAAGCGTGATMTGNITVAAGDVLTVYAAGRGSSSGGGWGYANGGNGGSGYNTQSGGGASAIVKNGVLFAEAGGGGGCGSPGTGGGWTGQAGVGGNAGSGTAANHYANAGTGGLDGAGNVATAIGSAGTSNASTNGQDSGAVYVGIATGNGAGGGGYSGGGAGGKTVGSSSSGGGGAGGSLLPSGWVISTAGGAGNGSVTITAN